MWLYKLTNTINGMAYIGATTSPLSHRVSRHLYASKTRNDMAVARAIKEYGLKHFALEILCETDDYDELLEMEVAAIASFQTRVPYGYNITAGGKGTRRPLSQEARERISASTQGRKPWNHGLTGEKYMSHFSNGFGGFKKGCTVNVGRKAWNSGIKTGKGGPPKGSKPWNYGKKTGPMPEEQRQRRAETMRQVRATRFWSTKPIPKDCEV